MIQLNPKHPRGYYNRGLAYEKLEQYERAVEDITRYLEFEPTDHKIYRNRAFAYDKLDMFDRAIDDVSYVLSVDPNKVDYLNRANLYLAIGKRDAALMGLSRFIELEENPIVILRRGMVYELVGAPGLARADYERVSAHDGPVAAYARIALHLLLRQTGQASAAADVLRDSDTARVSGLWTGRILAFLGDDVAPDDLLNAAASDDERQAGACARAF